MECDKDCIHTTNADRELFSIVVPTWNNLRFLKLCIESIRKNSSYRHQIIVHVNDGSDGTLEWVKAEGLDSMQKNICINV